MIVVKVELHSARTGEVSEIGRMLVINDGSGSLEKGNYLIRLLRRGSTSKVQREARVTGHARQSYSVWVLVAKALWAVGFGSPRAGNPTWVETAAEPEQV